MTYLREFDKTGHLLASIQARMFVNSAKDGLPSYNFIKVFSFLEYTESLDKLSFLYGSISEQDIYASTVKKMNKVSGGSVFTENELHWMGYFYRAFCYVTGWSSKETFRYISPSYLRRVYVPYHSLSIEKAIKMVVNELKLPEENDQDKIMRILRATN